MRLLYTLGIYFYAFFIRLAALFGNDKAEKWIEGRKNITTKYKSIFADESPWTFIWVHASSLGEFEQGRPFIETIKKTYPNQKMGYMSGTSMACPNALRYASMVLEANPNLKPVELKKILMSTVDKKEWLKDKVKTGGVINVTRAIEAAKAVKSGKTVAEACKLARKTVSDKVSRPAKRTRPDLKDPVVKKMYFSNVY